MKTTETNHEGECVYVAEAEHREELLGNQHKFTWSRPPKFTGPVRECPSFPVCRGVLCIATPGNQIPG